MTTAHILCYARSPFCPSGKGELSGTRPDDLLAETLRALVMRSGVDPALIEDVVCGCAFPEAEQGYNIARQASLLAGLPLTAGGATVNRFCGSSMQAIHQAAGMIALDAGDVFIACGVESMSRVPMLGFNPMFNPVLAREQPDAYATMGQTAENLATRYGIARDAQETYAVESQRKAADADANGRLVDEIVPIVTSGGVIDRDRCIRPGTSAEKLASLKAAFSAEGSVTAGTSSPLTDGAAAVVVVSSRFLERHGGRPLARIRGISIAGCEPGLMGYGPVPAVRKLLDRTGLEISDLDVIESNEAFSVQAMVVARELGFPGDRVNLDGGALAIGHPLGATGARITGKAAQLLGRTGGKYALATQCIGGGQGIATLLEAC